MSNVIERIERLEGVILSDRTLVFPPPTTDRKSLLERLPKRARSFTGSGLLRYFVSQVSFQSGDVNDANVIGSVTNRLWKVASSHERAEYTALASELNRRSEFIFQRRAYLTTTTMDLMETVEDLMDTETTTVDPVTTTEIANSPVKNFADIGYSNLHDVISWWEDEKELFEEDSEEDIMKYFFNEKFGEIRNFMDIVDGNHFSQQTKTALLDVYNDFLVIFDNYTPWEWFSWYIHMSCMSTRTPAPCPFHLGNVNLPENIQHYHYHYEGTISKNVKNEQVEQFGEFISYTLKDKYKDDFKSNVWYHGTNSVHAASIIQGIDLTVCPHFGHAFGFHRSFYIGKNLKYCLVRALKAAGTLAVNCALVVFCINDINEAELHQLNYLTLICQKDLQDNVPFDNNTWNIWENVVPISKNLNSIHNNLDSDPIQLNVQWVEGANLKRSNSSWIPKKDDTICSFRKDESIQFLQNQLAFIITFKNPRVK